MTTPPTHDDNAPSRFCLECGYMLNHLSTPVCPECGLEFDPLDVQTFSRRRRPARFWVSLAAWVCTAWPLLLLVSLYSTWLAAWATLGHRPRPSLDDPKYIGTLVDIPYFITGLMMIGAPPMCCAAMMLLVARALLRRRKQAQQMIIDLLLVLIPIVLLVGTVMLLRRDPGRVVYWFMD